MPTTIHTNEGWKKNTRTKSMQFVDYAKLDLECCGKNKMSVG